MEGSWRFAEMIEISKVGLPVKGARPAKEKPTLKDLREITEVTAVLIDVSVPEVDDVGLRLRLRVLGTDLSSATLKVWKKSMRLLPSIAKSLNLSASRSEAGVWAEVS